MAYQLLSVRIPLFPDSKISHSAHLVRHDVSIALMMAQGQARRIVRRREQLA
jgi:hypothetical protein